MSHVTIYECDRCKKKSTDVNELRLEIVGIGVKRTHYGPYRGDSYTLYDNAKREKEMCEICRIELGILPPESIKEEPQSAPLPTLEDMIKEIIRNELEERTI